MNDYKLDAEGSFQSEIQLESKMNFFQRLAGIIFSPTKTLMDLIAKPRLLFPILSSAFGMLLFYLLRYDLYKDYMRDSLERVASTTEALTPDQIEALLDMSAIAGLISTPFITLIVWALSGLVLFCIAKLFKGEGRFNQYLSIVGYCGVITLLFYAISAGVSFFTGQLMFDASMANITNLIIPDMKGSYFYGIIRSISFFTIWYYVLVGVGISLVSKLSKPKVFSMVAFVLIVEALINAAEFRYF